MLLSVPDRKSSCVVGYIAASKESVSEASSPSYSNMFSGVVAVVCPVGESKMTSDRRVERGEHASEKYLITI